MHLFNTRWLLPLAAVVALMGCGKAPEETFVDPIEAQVHTLENGLKVYLSVNKESPRIQTFIAVNTGSTNDPADATGLAHYLEHMLFKGTSHLGTADWANESAVLEQISALYEQHRATTDTVQRKAIYARIDSLSVAAAALAYPNEYDRLVKGMGAQGTNAFTSVERTVYINDIPSTELDKWLRLEAERFSELTLRLFHTELETVYEEYNRGRDSDYSLTYEALNAMLFPKHPYGTQTTIGKGEHLKNPSMVKIHEYFSKYYVPNNMAICLAGDFDPQQALDLIKKHFGPMQKKDVMQPVHPQEPPLTKVQEATVLGPMKEWVNIGFRFGGYGSNDDLMTEMLSMVIYNGTAGLMDLNLIQKQRILEGYAYSYVMRDYTTLTLSGTAKGGQSLEEVRDLILQQIALVKKGEFSDALMPATIRNKKVDDLNMYQYNWLRTSEMSEAFIMGVDWKEHITRTDRMARISKSELVQWANANLKDNYAVVYKRTGKNPDAHIAKPRITPLEINRKGTSPFYTSIDTMKSMRLTPEFLDFKTAIATQQLNNATKLYHVQNTQNELFEVFMELDENLKYDPKVRMALNYLNYLGTDSLDNIALKQRLYELGLRFSTESTSWKVYVAMSGIQESFDEGLKLMEHVLARAQPDSAAFAGLIADELKTREDNMKNKWLIVQGLTSVAKFGPKNKFNNQLSKAELEKLTPAELISIIRSLTGHSHRFFYYGPLTSQDLTAAVRMRHPVPAKLAVAPSYEFPELPTDKDRVLFADYDMVQTEVTMVSKMGPYDKSKSALHSLFSAYYGSGLSSVVFQEVRESRALAYSAYAFVQTPQKANESHYMQAYVGAQNDKLPEALTTMRGLLEAIPSGTGAQFEQARISAMKSIESNRVVRSGIFWYYRGLEDRGIDYDLRKETYSGLGKLTFADMESFFKADIAGLKYNYCVIGKKAEMDLTPLKKQGEFKEYSLPELFGYH